MPPDRARRPVVDCGDMDHGIRLSTVNINAPDPSALGRLLRPAARLGGRPRRRRLGGDRARRRLLPASPSRRTPTTSGRCGRASPGSRRSRCTSTCGSPTSTAPCGTPWRAAPSSRTYQPQDDVRVCLDPAGHAFCLWLDESERRVRRVESPTPACAPRHAPRCVVVTRRSAATTFDPPLAMHAPEARMPAPDFRLGSLVTPTSRSSTSSGPRSRRRSRSCGPACGVRRPHARRDEGRLLTRLLGPDRPPASRSPRRSRARRLVAAGPAPRSRSTLLVFELDPAGAAHRAARADLRPVPRPARTRLPAARDQQPRRTCSPPAHARLDPSHVLEERELRSALRSGARRSRAGRARTPAA